MADPLNLQQLISTLQNINVTLSTLQQTISSSTSALFPATQGTSTTASAGAIASPGNFAGFIDVQLPNGTTVKVPYFNG